MITKTVTLSTPYELTDEERSARSRDPDISGFPPGSPGVDVIYIARCGWCGVLEHVTTFRRYRLLADLPKFTPLPPDWRWQNGLPMCPKHEAIVIEKEIADVDPARAGAMAEREAKYALEQHAAIARFARQDAAALRNAARFARSRAGVKERYNSERPVRALPALTYRLSESATVDVDDLIRFLREVA